MSWSEGWSRVDAALASALEARRVLPRAEIARLHDLGKQHGVERGGSFLAGALVRAGTLRPEAVDQLLAAAVAASSSGRLQQSLGASAFLPPGAGAGAPFDATQATRVSSSSSGTHATRADSGRTQATRADHGPLISAAGSSGRVPAAPPTSPALDAIFSGERYEAREPLDHDRRLVLDKRLGRPVVLVEGRPSAPGAPPDRAFLREALVLSRLDHPAVPKVHEVSTAQQGGRPYSTTDWLEGESLTRVLARPEPERPSLPQLLRSFLAVAAAVAHAHEQRIVHGALAPELVVLGSRGRVWLGGWAQARALAGASEAALKATALALPPAGAVVRAPELRGGTPPDERTDVWGLGVLLHWILVRRPPGARGVLRGAGGIPRELKAVATMALAASPGERYRRVEDLQEDVRRFLDGRAVLAERDSLVRATVRLARRHPEVGAILSLLLGTVAVVTGWALADLRTIHRSADQARARARAAAAEVETRRAAATRSTEDAARIAAAAEDLARFDEALAKVERERALANATGGGGADLKIEAALAKAAEIEARLLAHARESLDSARNRSDVNGRADRDERRSFLDEAEHAAKGRLAWARAAFQLATRRGSPEKALADYELILALPRTTDAEKARAQLGRFLAARRMEGGLGRAEDAMSKLALLEDPLAAIGKLYPAYAAAWKRSADPLAVKFDRSPQSEETKKALEAAGKLVAERPELAFAHEILGALAAGNPGTSWGQAAGPAALASYLETTEDFFPAVLHERAFVRDNSLHAFPRWIAGRTFSDLDARLPLDPRPGQRWIPAQDAFSDFVTYLELLGRKPAALGFAERQLRTLAPLPESERRGRSPWTLAQLARARGLLASGKPPGDELKALVVPPELEAEKAILVAWGMFREENPDPGKALGVLSGALRQRLGMVAQSDLMDLLRDPAVHPRILVQVLDRFVAPRREDEGGEVLGLLARRALARSRLGEAIGEDGERILAILSRGQNGATQDPDSVLEVASLAQLELGLCQLARQRDLARDSRAAGPHVALLRLAASADLAHDSTEDVAIEAELSIAERLRRLGADEAARAFAGTDPVDEVYPRRDWVPESVHVWRRRTP